ncbi:prephenate dehydrogenase/arogenate dehydrogenase family protein [Maricaulis sp.]|uniref:prephenate dehydrogenase/arogenate dehydrogenase family protein n=2 Tax=Maricaulis sp. TaxID=1486257 RepID=UPI003296BDD7
MASAPQTLPDGRPAIGLIGLGAFGQLAAQHLAPHADLTGHDPHASMPDGVRAGTLAGAAAQPVVILAMPVQALAEVAAAIAPHIQPGALVIDVASVKLEPMRILRETLPAGTRILGTHPLFGPQSAAQGVAGQSIVLCPEPGVDPDCVASFLRERLALDVHLSDADTHDRTMASVQALTHLVSKVITDLDLPPAPYTTRSFDLLAEAARLVSQDSDALFRAIERHNPHAADLRRRFFEAARALDTRLAE